MMKNLLALLKYWHKHISLGILVVVLVYGVSAFIYENYEAFDYDPNRGAAVVEHDVFGDKVSTIQYLNQGWKPNDSLWFYNTTQGSDLLPYDFFLVLEQPGSTALL